MPGLLQVAGGDGQGWGLGLGAFSPLLSLR